MENILDKLSSYNILNNLLPGAVFCYLMDFLFKINLLTDDAIMNLCIVYFIGMIISRIGSIVIEPLFKKMGFIIFADYKDYVVASKKDFDIKVLSETNNLYRSILGLLFSLLIVKLYLIIIEQCSCLNKIFPTIFIILLFILFAFSYRKQTKYIKSRVEKVKGEREAVADEHS